MTVPIQDPIVSYVANGVTTGPFTFPFRILQSDDLKVVFAGTLAAPSTYAISGLGDDEGSVTFFTVPPVGTQIILYRQVALERTDDYQFNGDLRAVTVNADFDRIWMAIQDIGDSSGRAIQYPITEFGTDGTLPVAALRASNVLGFDDTGKQTLVPIGSQLGAGDLRFDTFPAGVGFTPNVTTQLALSRAPISKGNCWVYWDGTPQLDFTLSGNTLIFPTAIPSGISNVYVRIGTTLSLNTPAQESVVDASLAPGSRIYNRAFFSIDITDYGADRFGVINSDGALAAALAEARARGGAKITAPAGKFKFSSKQTYTFPALKSALAIEGQGPGITEFAWVSADALQFNYLGRNNAVQMRGLTVSTGTSGGGNGVFLNQTAASIPDPGNSSLNIFDSVVFCGSDGLAASDFWGTALKVFGVSNINLLDVMATGNGVLAPYSVLGAGFDISGTEALPSVVYNFTRCTANCVNVGINYGNWVQGMSLAQTNLTGNAIGIAVSAGITGLDQLAITGGQFNCVTGLNLLSALENVQVCGVLFIIPNMGTAINAQYASMLMVGQSTFEPAALTGISGQAGIVVNNCVGPGGVISGNAFFNLFGTGLILQSSSVNVKYGPNVYANNTTNIVDTGTNTAVGGG